jgi:hypothetical protein
VYAWIYIESCLKIDNMVRFRLRGKKKLPRSQILGTLIGGHIWDRELRVEFSPGSGLLRLGTALHSHSSGLLIHRSGYSYVCSGLEVGMEFGAVKIRV